jgi:hypothetical protein
MTAEQQQSTGKDHFCVRLKFDEIPSELAQPYPTTWPFVRRSGAGALA